MFEVLIRKKVLKNVEKLPGGVKIKFLALVEDLKELGPIRTDWPYYSKLGKEKYHCHLGHSWVACWIHKKNTVIIEVYYAGSRENAQY